MSAELGRSPRGRGGGKGGLRFYWFGGGACELRTQLTIINGGGGGGAGFIGATTDGGVLTARQAATVVQQGGAGAGQADPHYRAGIGTGGGSLTNGGDGLVIFQFNTEPTTMTTPKLAVPTNQTSQALAGTETPGNTLTIT